MCKYEAQRNNSRSILDCRFSDLDCSTSKYNTKFLNQKKNSSISDKEYSTCIIYWIIYNKRNLRSSQFRRLGSPREWHQHLMRGFCQHHNMAKDITCQEGKSMRVSSGLSSLSYKVTNPLPKAPPPNNISIRGLFPTQEIWGTLSNIYLNETIS